ncbi:MAG TPA: cyclase family protein [Acidimicrobiia bacterium]
MNENRVVFDFDITFSNGGSLHGEDFRLDIDGDSISDASLIAQLVDDLNLLMVGEVEISRKRYVPEPHKRAEADGATSGLVDLSHPIRDGEVTYPGLPAPVIRTHLSREQSRANYSEGTEFQIGGIDMVANTGTYVDAPFHRYPEGGDIASVPLRRLVGVPGVVVDATETRIGPEVFADTDTWGRAVLVRTGWDRRFGGDGYLGGHPHLTEAAATRLVDGGAALVGIDSANIDDTSGGTRPAHSALLAAGIPIVEHLANLDRLPTGPFEFFAIPAPVVGMGTFPVRAVARWG